ncbi:MAG: SET domain-containing methyltransferase [Chitinophagaceae bacterium]|nr:SET domain-containing methyltransferase [Chitinophagaceae bacterium]
MITLTNSRYRIISDHNIAEIRQNETNGQKSLFARQAWKAGDIIGSFNAGEVLYEPTYLTVQVDKHKHITLQPEFLQYMNHSCSPNAFFDTTTMRIVALQNIEAGEELTFFYPSTEWDMAQPFTCYCGSSNCLGEIRGAAWIPADIISQYRLTDFIQRQLHDRSNEERA